MHLPPHAFQLLVAAALLVLAIVAWIIVLMLLMAVTSRLLDTLRFIVDLGAMT